MYLFRSKKYLRAGGLLSSYKIRRSKVEIEPQEVLLDRLAKEKESEISNRRIEVPLRKQVLQGFMISIFIFFLLLASRTFYFQFFKGEEFALLAAKNREKFYSTRPQRGIIYDKNKEQLVFNKETFDLICEKKDLPFERRERDEMLKKASRIVDRDFDNLREEVEKSDLSRVLVKENLTHEELILLETEISSGKITGFSIQENATRNYLGEGLFSHLLGFTGKISKEELEVLENYSFTDQVGKKGLEKSYEQILRGNQGTLMVEKDAQGNIVSKKTITESEAGENLVLYLDSNLQKKLTEELSGALERSGTKKAVAIALDPKTGGVLSLVSLPYFDSNIFSQSISQEDWEKLKNNPDDPFFNRVISGIGYPTGSTIKPFIATAALEEKVIPPQKEISCQGVISVDNPYFPEIEPEKYEYHDWKVHGFTDMRKAIAESCNIFFYTVGGGYEGFEGLGPNRIIKWLKLFGWEGPTGVDLPGEGRGILPEIDKDWRLGNTYHLSIGQGAFSITPLQVVTAFSAIANGGTLYRPKVVKEILDQSGNIIEDMGNEVLREDFIQKENLKIVKEGMRQAVTSPSGSSFILNSLPVSSAAKTGTAQTAKDEVYHSWVTVFAPYEDPEIVLTIMVEDVPGLQVVVLPVAKEVLNWYFSSR